MIVTLVAVILAHHLAGLHYRYNRYVVGREFLNVLAMGGAVMSIAALRNAASTMRGTDDRLTQDEIAASLVLTLLVWLAEQYLGIFAIEAFLASRNREIYELFTIVALLASVVLSFVVPAYLVGSFYGQNPFSTAWTILMRRPLQAFIFWFEVIVPMEIPIRLFPSAALVVAARWAPAALLIVPLALAAMAFFIQAYWSARIGFYLRLREAITAGPTVTMP